jgi:hypothetical protein
VFDSGHDFDGFSWRAGSAIGGNDGEQAHSLMSPLNRTQNERNTIMKRTTLVAALALLLGATTAIQAFPRSAPAPAPRPPQRPHHQNNGPWTEPSNNGLSQSDAAAIGGIIGIIGRELIRPGQQQQQRPPQRPPQQYYPPQQQYYPQEYYPEPQYVPVQQYPAAAVQPAKPVEVKPLKNSVPKVVKPIALKANMQSLARQVKVASVRYAKDTARALNLASQQSLDDLTTGLQDSNAILSEKGKKEIEDFLRAQNLPPDKVKNLMDALNANDPQAIQTASQELNLDTLFMNKDMTNSLIAGANLSIRLNDLKDAVANGATPEQIAQQVGQVAADIQQMNLPAVNTLGLSELLNQVVLSSQVTGGMGNGTGIGPAGTPTDFPTGECLIVCDPNMASGQTCLLPGETICVGTGGQGPLQVMEGTAASALGLPSGTEPPVEDASGTAAVLGANGITIINPEATGAAVNYRLGTEAFVLEAGKNKQHGSTNQVIVFDKGESFGETRYTLAQGTYRFATGETGWDLKQATFTVTIDNSDSPIDFSYAFNNSQVTIPAGGVKTHTSNSLPVVRFNKGDDGEDSRKELDSGTFYVAIDPDTNLIDIFAAKPQPSKIAVPKKKTGRQTVKKFGIQK